MNITPSAISACFYLPAAVHGRSVRSLHKSEIGRQCKTFGRFFGKTQSMKSIQELGFDSHRFFANLIFRNGMGQAMRSGREIIPLVFVYLICSLAGFRS
jgi:hypothetical protein